MITRKIGGTTITRLEPSEKVPHQKRTITPLEFFQLLTFDEKKALLSGVKSSQALSVAWEELKLADKISVNNAVVPGALLGADLVLLLEVEGVILPGRVDKIAQNRKQS